MAADAVRLAHESAAREDDTQGKDDRAAHVGYYLIDKGLAQLEHLAGVRLSVTESLRKASSRFPLFLYLGTIMLITAIFTGGLLAKANADGLQPWLLLANGHPLTAGCESAGNRRGELAGHAAGDAASAAAHGLLRRNSAGIARPWSLIPTMLTSARNIEDLIEALEVRFLANRDNNLHFGLLTDFQDAAEETLPEDEPLLLLARQRIEELNEKYGNAKGDTFFLFHRPRRWNPRERVWMGYERKRGKLAELNSLLRGGSRSTGFSLVVGNTAALLNVKYVITLDTDTQLPRDSARQLVGAMAHPLNRALYDEGKQRVVAGYGILQPRVAVSLPGTNRSRYARMDGSDPGIDPYTRAVSDVYQDLFLEGSFIGKGIYEVDAFERALGGRFPENRILSHDLIEGCYARVGTVERRHGVRGIPFPLQRGREPPAPVDPRGLAASVLAAGGCPRSRARA